MIELIEKRQENSKTFKLDDRREQQRISIGAIHYKDNYADKSEQWKDIDLNWKGNEITKAPYKLTLEGNKLTIRDKKSGEVSTIELLEIGGTHIPAQDWEHSKGLAKALDTDLEIVADNEAVRFAHILKSDEAPMEAKFKVTGNFVVHAEDVNGELPVEATLKDGILTETLKPDRAIKYPVRIDPTLNLQVGASTDDILVAWNGSSWFSSTSDSLQLAGFRAASDWEKVGGGLRFLNVTIPQGSTIDVAYLTFTCSNPDSLTVVNTKITGEDVDDAATFSDIADYQARRGIVVGGANDNYITTAQVDWDANSTPSLGAWTAETEYNSPEIKTIIQEIIDRPGFVDKIVLFWDDHDNRSTNTNGTQRRAYSFNGSAAKAPQLVLTYLASVISAVIIGVVPSASRALAYDRDSSTIIGALTSASRVYGRIRQAAVIAGVVASASRVFGRIRSTSVIVGNLVAATRGQLTLTRASSTIIGVAPTAARNITMTESSTVDIGIVSTASRKIAAIRSAIKTIGIVVTATRPFLSFTRAASVIVGALVTASAVAGVQRAIVYIGVKVIASRNITKALAAAVAIEIAVTATRGRNYIRTASTIVGIVATTVIRQWGRVRTASVLIGNKATATRTIAAKRVDSIQIGIVASAIRTLAATRTATTKVGLTISAIATRIGRVLKMLIYGRDYKDMTVYTKPHYDMEVSNEQG